jgi:nucleotide-binding universal stress UspA family protein
MFSRVLVPLDGSPAAETAVAYTALIPARALTLLTVVPKPDTAGYDWETDVASDVQHAEQRARAEAYLAKIADDARAQLPGRQISLRVAEGDPSEQIIGASTDANLVVMTAHGHGATSSEAFGRVVDRVARHAGIPTLVIRGGDGIPAELALSRIVVPLDGSDVAGEAVPLATELACQTGTDMFLVSVVDPSFVPGASLDRAREVAGQYLASEAQRVSCHAVQVTTRVLTGVPAAEITALVGPADLIVVTAFGAGTGKRWLLGGVAGKLIRHAAAPVLVVRAPNA